MNRVLKLLLTPNLGREKGDVLPHLRIFLTN